MSKLGIASEKDGYDEGHEVTLDEALDLAKGHHVEGNLLLAERTYRDILRAAPDHFPTTHFLGVLLYQMTVLDEALIYMEKAVESAPKDKQCWNNLGAVLTDLQRWDDALKVYEKALDIDPDFVEALNNKALTLWLLNKTGEAIKIARKCLELNPGSIESRTTLGIALSSEKQYEEAEQIWKELAEEAPQFDKIWINWGNTLRDMGRLAESEVKCRKALELSPDNPEAHSNLGNALRDRGNIDEALKHYRRATDLRPEFFDAHANTAIALCDLLRFEEAAIAARYAVAFKRESAKANSALSLALRHMGQYSEARAAALRAIKGAPDSADPYLDLADVNLMSDYLSDAEAALEEALKRSPDSPRTYKKLAEVRERMGDNIGALKAIDRAIEMSSDMPLLWIKKTQILQLEDRMEEAFVAVDRAMALAPRWHMPQQMKAELYISQNENEKAAECCRAAMALNPNVPGPYATLLGIEKVKDAHDPHFQKLLEQEKNDMKFGLTGASVIHYALSESYEQLKDFDKSFEHLKKANDYKRKTLPFNAALNRSVHQNVKAKFTPDLFKIMKGKGYESDIPVFIVGMPRSGTTLTEQIISSHPSVFGAGELMEITKIREQLGGLTSDNVREFGEKYVAAIKERDPAGNARHITDKMPGNYVNLGVIACILPNAKIIHCRRDPVDTCLSCYKQNFANGQYWSYDLEELAQEYNNYASLMEHWRKVLPGRFLEVDYEDTVNDLEKQARRLIDFIGLPWDDACLVPHEQKRTVLTASKLQVTQPVYKTSVQKWRKYETHLKPLLEKLEFKPGKATA